MAFPTIPTTGAGRVLTTFQANTTSPRTLPNLSSLTKDPGDLLIAIIVGYQSSLTSAIYSSWGGGFTEIRDIGVASQMCLGVAYKWSDGTETGTFTVAQAGTITGHAGMILLSIPGAHASTAPEVTAALANGTAAAANPAALNPAGWDVEDTLWIAVGANGETALTGSYTGMGLAAGPPTSYTDAVSTGESGDVIGAVALAVAFRQNAIASEDVGPWSSIDLSNARNVAAVIAVRPAPPVDNRNASPTATGAGVLTSSPVKGAVRSQALTGAGVLTSSRATARQLAAALTGGGVLTRTTVKGAVRSQLLTGAGVAVVTGEKFIPAENHDATFSATGAGRVTSSSTKGAVQSPADTGGGVATLARVSARSAAVTGTASGTGVIARSTQRARSQALTGGGVAAVTKAGGRAGSTSATGAGTASLSRSSARQLAAALSASGRVTISVAGTSPDREASLALTGGGVAQLARVAGRAGSTTATGAGTASLSVLAARQLAAALTGGGVLTSSSAVDRAWQLQLTGGGRVSFGDIPGAAPGLPAMMQLSNGPIPTTASPSDAPVIDSARVIP